MLLEVEHVSKMIGTREVIHELNFTLKKGKIFALLGPNGAGKTTIVRLITGLLKPTKGEIKLFDKRIDEKNSAQLRQKIGVQNDGNLYEELTVEQNLDLWGELYGIESNRRKEQIRTILSFFDLEDRRHSKVGQLSEGRRQKVAIARDVFHGPELLILDDPTSGLDPQSTEELIIYLNKLVETAGMSIIMCTHQLLGLEEIADDIGILQKGHLTTFGSAAEIIKNQFPEISFEIEAHPKDKAIEICKSFSTVHETSQDAGFQLAMTTALPISQVIKQLVQQEVAINNVFKVKHTIKDVYFKTVIGAKSNEFNQN